MFLQPVLLNEVLVKLPDPSSDEPVFHISHIDRVYVLRTDNINERWPRAPGFRTCGPAQLGLCELTLFCVWLFSTAWVQKIKAASEEFIDTEKKKRDKAYHGASPHAQPHPRCASDGASD